MGSGPVQNKNCEAQLGRSGEFRPDIFGMMFLLFVRRSMVMEVSDLCGRNWRDPSHFLGHSGCDLPLIWPRFAAPLRRSNSGSGGHGFHAAYRHDFLPCPSRTAGTYRVGGRVGALLIEPIEKTVWGARSKQFRPSTLPALISHRTEWFESRRSSSCAPLDCPSALKCSPVSSVFDRLLKLLSPPNLAHLPNILAIMNTRMAPPIPPPRQIQKGITSRG